MKPRLCEAPPLAVGISPSVKNHSRTRAAASPGNCFALELRIRGQADYVFESACMGLEEAVRLGEMCFLRFDARNPWFVQDSLRRRIVILLDPLTECIREQAYRNS